MHGILYSKGFPMFYPELHPRKNFVLILSHLQFIIKNYITFKRLETIINILDKIKHMAKKGWPRLTVKCTAKIVYIITCLNYVQNNKIKRLPSLLINVFQFNDSFVPVSCLRVSFYCGTTLLKATCMSATVHSNVFLVLSWLTWQDAGSGVDSRKIWEGQKILGGLKCLILGE